MGFSREEMVVGREGLLSSHGFEISVIIRDVRLNPNAIDYLIEPTAGKGKTWINKDKIRIVE